VPPAPHRVLRTGLLALLTLVAAALIYSLFDRAPAAIRPLTALVTAEGVAQRALNLDATRTRRGLPSFRVTAREALTYREGNTELRDVVVTLFGPGQERTEVSAPLALSGERGSGGAWSFRNGVEVRGADGLRVKVPNIRYRESPQEISSEGDVVFERGDLTGSAKGLRYVVARRRLEFLSSVEVTTAGGPGGIRSIRADSAALDQGAARVVFKRYRLESDAGEEITGSDLEVVLRDEGPRIRSLLASAGFRATSPGGPRAAGWLGHGGRTLAGDSLSVDLLEDGQVGAVKASGRVEMGIADPVEGARTLTCGRLAILFDGGRAVSLAAEDEASLSVPRAPGRGGTVVAVRAGSILAQLGPGGEVGSVEAKGGATAEEAGRRLSAARMTYEAVPGTWVLDGEPTVPARVDGEGSTISAARIEMRRSEGTMSARGSVKTTTVPKSESAAGPQAGRPSAGLLGGGGAPVHGMCEALTFLRGGKVVRYREKVRIWQEGASLEAAAVDLLDDGGAIEARGGVVARAPARRKDATAAQIVTVSSSEMRYARDTAEARFTGTVRAQSGALRVDAATITVRGGSGEEGIHEMVAEGGVRFQQGTRAGEGDVLVASLREDRFVLSGRGRLATIQDQSSQQVVKGTVLTYEGGADRILVESETGGRTWITLRPRSGEGKKSDPEPPH